MKFSQHTRRWQELPYATTQYHRPGGHLAQPRSLSWPAIVPAQACCVPWASAEHEKQPVCGRSHTERISGGDYSAGMDLLGSSVHAQIGIHWELLQGALCASFPCPATSTLCPHGHPRCSQGQQHHRQLLARRWWLREATKLDRPPTGEMITGVLMRNVTGLPYSELLPVQHPASPPPYCLKLHSSHSTVRVPFTACTCLFFIPHRTQMRL